MRVRPRTRLGVESLEGRALLSSVPAMTKPHAVSALVAAPARKVILNGTIRGVYAIVPTAFGPSPFEMSGTGRVSPLGGQAQLFGVVSTLPLTSSATLDLSLSNRRGSINLRITPGLAPVNPLVQPIHLRYTLLGGTGAYRNAAGAGSADVTIKPNFGTLGTVGAFTMRLHFDRPRG